MEYEVSTRIKKIRINRNMSVSELAKKANISTKFLYDIEYGRKGFSADVLLRISKALNVSCDYILAGDEENPDSELMGIIRVLDERERRVIMKIACEIIGLRSDR